MKVVPYLVLNGNAEAAINFYVEALGGSIRTIMRFGDHEMPGVTEENQNLIMHGEIQFGDNLIYLSDNFEPNQYTIGNAYTIHLDCVSETEIRDVFEKLAFGGRVINPLEDTFWGAIYGYVVDQFGISWSFNYQKS